LIKKKHTNKQRNKNSLTCPHVGEFEPSTVGAASQVVVDLHHSAIGVKHLLRHGATAIMHRPPPWILHTQHQDEEGEKGIRKGERGGRRR
jgi:hypothetical protein